MEGLETRSHEVYDVALDGSLSLRLYEGSRPHNLEIAPLQKGLIMVLHGEELVGEGTGFGVPVVKYADVTYFSRTAVVYFCKAGEATVISKRFKLDTTSKKKVKYQRVVSNCVYDRLRDTLADAYRNRKHLRALISPLMEV